MMDNHISLNDLLLVSIPFSQYKDPSIWYENRLTQGNPLPVKEEHVITRESDFSTNNITEKTRAEQKNQCISFIDYFVSNIDDMFSIYPNDIRRDARVFTKDRLMDWVTLYARKFFGPSTSRSISTCLRGNSIEMIDLEKFAEFVSFIMNIVVKVGTKTVVWHGYTDESRDPMCELLIKKQGVFVKKM